MAISVALGNIDSRSGFGFGWGQKGVGKYTRASWLMCRFQKERKSQEDVNDT